VSLERSFTVTFRVRIAADAHCSVVELLGSSSALGAWQPGAGVRLSPVGDGCWQTTLPVLTGLPLEYKYCLQPGAQWEPVPANRSLALPAEAFNGSAWLRDDGLFGSTANVLTLSVPTSSDSAPPSSAPAAVVAASTDVAKPKKKKKKAAAVRGTDTSAALELVLPEQPAPLPSAAAAAAATAASSSSFPAPTSKAPEPPAPAQAADSAAQRQGILEALFQFSVPESVRCLQFDTARPWLAVGLQNRVQVYDYEARDVEFSTPPFPKLITAVAFSLNMPHLAVGVESGDAWLYDFAARQLLPGVFKGHSKAVRAIVFHPKLPWVITGSDDTTIRFWDFNSATELAQLTGHRYAVRSLHLANHCSELLVSASLDRTVRVWDFATDAKGKPWDFSSAVGADARPTVACVASLSTASVPAAHSDGVAFACAPEPNLIVSASIDGEVVAFQMTGLGAGDKPRELYVDVIDTASLRLPRRADLIAHREAAAPPPGNDAHLATALGDAAELDGGTGLYRGAGVLRITPELIATLFVNDSVAYLSTLAQVPDGTEMAAVLEPICFAVLGGTGGVLSPVDVDVEHAKGCVEATPEHFELVTLARAHASQPIFAVLHADNTIRVMRVTPQFSLLLQVHNSTQLLSDKKTWLATITRGVTAQAVAQAFASHADALGVAVTMDAQNKSKFAARLRAAPARALDVQIGINDDGKRVLQAQWNDERDSVLWRDLLRSFALLFLARNKLLLDKSRRFINTEASVAAADAAATQTICSVQ